jgi:hypothetical protein
MTFKSSSGVKPQCYGDSDEYSDTSSYCRACPFAADCREALEDQINKVAIRSAKVPNVRKYSNYSSSTPTTYAKSTTSSSNAIIRPVKFNHNKPLATQYITYVGYDVAEAMASRAVDLVRSCRAQYENELHESNTNNGDS